jgi:hypothetical protein
VRDVELRHGYTLAQLNRLAVFAVRRGLFNQSADFNDRLEAAWSAIAEHLYASPTPPSVGEVVNVGWKAIGDWVRRDQQFRGQNTSDRYAGTRHNFVRYWWTAAGPTPSPENRIIERVALWEIWAQLRPLDREVLGALAAHEDYGRAAEALGKSRKTFTTQVAQARQEFLRLWHEGEQPSRPWGQDHRRRSETSTDRHARTYVIRQRERSRAKNGTPKPKGGGRASLLDEAGVSREAVAARYGAGESIRQLAGSFGVSFSAMQRWMTAKGIELRAGGRQFDAVDGQARTDLGISAEELSERYHGQGQSLRRIADDLGVDPKTVQNFMRRKGIARRPAGRRRG